MTEVPNLFSYIDHRKWLSDLSEYRKRTTKYFSHRWFAQAAGIKNPSFFSQIVSGRRNLTLPMIDRFSEVLELDSREALFFRHLVQFNQSETALEKQEHYAILREMSGSVNQTMLGEDAWDFYEHWWIAAVRELLAQRRVFSDWNELGSWLRPPIHHRQARVAVELLVDTGLVRQDDDGIWHLVHKDLTSGEEIRSLAVRNHNRQMAQLGVESIERFPPRERHVSGITLGVSAAGYQVLVTELHAFRERIVRLVDKDPGGGEVYQLNLQLFPLSGGGAP